MANRGRKENDELRAYILSSWRDMTDTQIAKEFGDWGDLKTTAIKIRQIRRRLGLQRANRAVMTPEEQYNDALLKRRIVEKNREKRVLDRFKRSGLYNIND